MFRNMFILSVLALCFQNPLCIEGKTSLNIEVEAESAVLMNARTGQILFEKQAHKPQYPASTTKVASMSYALEQKGQGHFDEQIVADQDSVGAISGDQKKRSNYTKPAYWLEFGGTHMGIKTGEVLTLRDLYYGAMLISANDATNLIAKDVAGDMPKFMEGLNKHARDLGAYSTHFENPHGLQHPKQLTTAYDLALIASRASANPLFVNIASTLEYRRPKTNKQESTLMCHSTSALLNSNRKKYYEPLLWVKTGWHSDSKHNIVAAAEKDGRLLVAVLMRGPSKEGKYRDVVKMFEAAFAEKKVTKDIIAAGSQTFSRHIERGTSPDLRALTKQNLSIEYFPSEEPKIQTRLYWKALNLPIAQGAEVGYIELELQPNGNKYITPLYAQGSIDKDVWAKFQGAYRQWFWVPALLCFLLGFLFIFERKKQTVQSDKVI